MTPEEFEALKAQHQAAMAEALRRGSEITWQGGPRYGSSPRQRKRAPMDPEKKARAIRALLEHQRLRQEAMKAEEQRIRKRRVAEKE